jgi:hypothetical protein
MDPLAAYKKKQLTPSFGGSQVSSLRNIRSMEAYTF